MKNLIFCHCSIIKIWYPERPAGRHKYGDDDDGAYLTATAYCKVLLASFCDAISVKVLKQLNANAAAKKTVFATG